MKKVIRTDVDKDTIKIVTQGFEKQDANYIFSPSTCGDCHGLEDIAQCVKNIKSVGTVLTNGKPYRACYFGGNPPEGYTEIIRRDNLENGHNISFTNMINFYMRSGHVIKISPTEGLCKTCRSYAYDESCIRAVNALPESLNNYVTLPNEGKKLPCFRS